jgi:hypothetical protein
MLREVVCWFVLYSLAKGAGGALCEGTDALLLIYISPIHPVPSLAFEIGIAPELIAQPFRMFDIESGCLYANLRV